MRCGSSCTGSSSMPDDALGCRPSVTVAASGPNPMLRSQLPATEGGGVHPLSVNHSLSGNSAVTMGASPAGKSVGLPSLASLIPSDSSRDVYLQRVQVSSGLLLFQPHWCSTYVASLHPNSNHISLTILYNIYSPHIVYTTPYTTHIMQQHRCAICHHSRCRCSRCINDPDHCCTSISFSVCYSF